MYDRKPDGRWFTKLGGRWRKTRSAPQFRGVKAIGSEIRQMREDWGYSLEELSSAVGVGTRTMQGIETGERGVDRRTLERIDNLMHCSLVSKYWKVVG